MHQHNTLKRRGTQFLIDCKINSILWSHSFISCQCWVVYQQSHITIQSNLKWLERKRWIIPYFWFPWRSSFEISEFLSPQRKRGGKSLHLNATPGETCTSRQLFHINCTETKTRMTRMKMKALWNHGDMSGSSSTYRVHSQNWAFRMLRNLLWTSSYLTSSNIWPNKTKTLIPHLCK